MRIVTFGPLPAGPVQSAALGSVAPGADPGRARGSWIPLFTRRDDDEGDLQTVQPRRRGGSPTSQGSRQGTVLLWTFSAPAFRRSMVLLFIGDEKLCCATMVGPRLSTGN